MDGQFTRVQMKIIEEEEQEAIQYAKMIVQQKNAMVENSEVSSS